MAKQTPHNVAHARAWRIIASLFFTLLGIYLLTTHWQTVLAGLRLTLHGNPVWLIVCLLGTSATFFLAAATYGLLALKKLRYRQTLLVELAASFANRLVPGGLGGLGLHGLYLHKRNHSVAQATAVVSVNNLLGVAAHLSLLAVVLVVRPHSLQTFTNHYDVSWQGGAVLFVGIVVIASIPFVRRKISSFGRNLVVSVHCLRPLQVLGAAGLSLLLTVTYTVILFASAHSIGLQVSLLQTFIVFSIGMLVGTATPTPGGLVGTEAGLFAGFISYGATPSTAAGVVLLYRLATYWLPLIPGVCALLIARTRGII